MIVVSILYATVSGHGVSIQGVLTTVGKDTLDYVLPLVANVAFWCGILEIAKDNGLLFQFQKLLSPILNKIFPDLKNQTEAKNFIAANIVMNMFGLGSAATPSGLQAMQSMQKENPNKEVATRSMVTFLVLNTAGVTLFNTTILSLRSQFEAENPSDFLLYAFLATMFSCVVGLCLDRWWNYGRR